MRKREARILRQRRAKRRTQNIRYQEREAGRRKQAAERRKIVDNFKIESVSEERLDYISRNCLSEICFLCEKRVLKKDLKAKRFVALKTNYLVIFEYVMHYTHFFEDDLATKKPDADVLLQLVNQKIRSSELKEILEEQAKENG